MKITFLGANHEVTGSCTLIEAAGQRFLIDCGMEQGKDVYENQPIPVAPGEIDWVLATHAHIDHTGMVDVCMGGQHPVDLAGCHRDGLVLVYVLALFHAAVDQKALSSRFDQSAAAGDLMVRAQKCDLHKNTSGFISSVPLV